MVNENGILVQLQFGVWCDSWSGGGGGGGGEGGGGPESMWKAGKFEIEKFVDIYIYKIYWPLFCFWRQQRRPLRKQVSISTFSSFAPRHLEVFRLPTLNDPKGYVKNSIAQLSKALEVKLPILLVGRFLFLCVAQS